MNDKELADKVVALGDKFYVSEPGFAYFMYVNDDRNLAQGVGDFPEQFVRDWRVAGALMEKYQGSNLIYRVNYEDGFEWMVEPDQTAAARQNESLPRAIIEACVEALSD